MASRGFCRKLDIYQQRKEKKEKKRKENQNGKEKKRKIEKKNEFFGINKHLNHVQSCCKE